VSPAVTAAVEGDIDEAVVAKILEHLGLEEGPCHICRGQAKLLERLSSYNEAAQFQPWVVLTDLDAGATGRCVGEFLREHLPRPSRHMYCRVAVQQVEAWLLGDVDALAAFLSTPLSAIPSSPDDCRNAKEAMIQAGRRSRRRATRDGMAPRHGSDRSVGPEYTGLMIEYALYHWRPDEARQRSPSLNRSLIRLVELAAGQ
jgi:hypothetical protein